MVLATISYLVDFIDSPLITVTIGFVVVIVFIGFLKFIKRIVL